MRSCRPLARSQFYTYLWLREDGTPYYVGKGTGKRAIRKGSPQDLTRILIQEHESEADAFTAEIFLIAYYGRIDLGTGCLRNRTDGGEGHSGYVTPPALRAKRSQLFSGENHPNWGKKLSPETCRRMSEAVSGDKHVMKGKTLPDSWRHNISAARVGKPLSSEHVHALRTDYWERRENADELKAMLRRQSSQGAQAVKDKWAQVPVPEFRECRICKTTKPLNEDNFSPARKGFGFDYRCKPCNAARSRLRRTKPMAQDTALRELGSREAA